MEKEEKRNVTAKKSLKRQALKKTLKARENILIAIVAMLITLLISLFSVNNENIYIIISISIIVSILIYNICVIIDYEDVYESVKDQEKIKHLESILIQDEDNIAATVEVVPVKFKAYSTYMQDKVREARFYAKLYKAKEEVMIFIEEKDVECLMVYDRCKLLEFEKFWKVNVM